MIEPVCAWRPIVGFEGIYSVSNLGQIRRTSNGGGNAKAGRILSQTFDQDGYRLVRLYRNGVRHSFRVHRVVAFAFFGDPPPRHVVNHKNGLKDDNRAGNLEWVTHARNVAHAVATGLLNHAGANNPRATFARAQVAEILRRFIETDETVVDLALIFLGSKDKIPYTRIYRIVTRKQWKHIPCDEFALAVALRRKTRAYQKRTTIPEPASAG